MRVNASLQRVTALNSSIHPAFKRTPSFFLNSFPEMRRFARGWTTLVFYSNRGNKKKRENIYSKRSGVNRGERDNMLLRTVSYSVSWQFGSGRVDRRHETRVKFRDRRKGTMRMDLVIYMYCWFRIIVRLIGSGKFLRSKNWINR